MRDIMKSCETLKPKARFHGSVASVVEAAIGERMDGSPLPDPEPDTRNPQASEAWRAKKVVELEPKISLQPSAKLSPKKLPDPAGVNNFRFPFFSLICGKILGH